MNDILIKMEKVSKTYKTKIDELKIINELNFSISEGEFVSILGKSGSGKTTFLNLLGLLDVPDSGEMYYGDKNVHSLKEKEKNIIRNEFLGFIFQFHFLLPEFTALENVMIPALLNKKQSEKSIKEKACELLEEMGLSERIDHKPNQLSGGEKQRVAIARALINSPKVILADEPTGNLDDETSAGIHNLLKNINQFKNQTIIVVTHSTELSMITQKKLILKKGILSLKEVI